MNFERLKELAGIVEPKIKNEDYSTFDRDELISLKEKLTQNIKNSFFLSESVLNDKIKIAAIDKVLQENLKKVNGKWALVSKKTGKPLRYYDGEGKPSDKWVSDQEKAIHAFAEKIEMIDDESLNEDSKPRLIDTIKVSSYAAKIYRNADFDEYLVKYFKDGKQLYVSEESDGIYYTSDLEDAKGTAMSELERMVDLENSRNESKLEEEVDMGKPRLMDVIKNDPYTAKIYKNLDLDEYFVKYFKNGKQLNVSDDSDGIYYTSDLDDAIGTAKLELEQMSKVTESEEMVDDIADKNERTGVAQDEETKIDVPKTIFKQIDKRIKELEKSMEEFSTTNFQTQYDYKQKAIDALKFIKEKLEMGNRVGLYDAVIFYGTIANFISELFPASLVKFLHNGATDVKVKPRDSSIYPQK